MANRSFEVPKSCRQRLETRGFINVTERAYRVPLDRQHTNGLHREIIENWMPGFEAYALEMMTGTMEIRALEVLLLCAAARTELMKNRHQGYLKR